MLLLSSFAPDADQREAREALILTLSFSFEC
jgi:hypothetical protein